MAKSEAIEPLKIKRPGALAHLNLHISDDFFFDPLFDELALREGGEGPL